MNDRQTIARRSGLLLLAAALLVTCLADGAEARRRGGGDFELVLEGGAVMPMGDLGDDYFGTLKGMGAETGYMVGARLRTVWRSGWALAPSFHYAEFGDFAATLQDLGAFEISTSILRYGLDVQYFFPVDRGVPQPFVGAGAALYRNRYTDRLLDERTFYEASTTGLGLTFGGGVRVGALELGIDYHLNRFDSARLPVDFGIKTDYDWDYLSLRAGFVLPAN